MSRKKGSDKSVNQLVSNCARGRGIDRDDGFTSYVMDRFLYRLGRSSQAKELFLKGGLLVANLVNEPHRFTRDIDTARSHGPCDPDDIRKRFREVVQMQVEDGIVFDPDGVRAMLASRDDDGYDGVKVMIRATVGAHEVDIRVDVGFGDAIVPAAKRTTLQPFLETSEPAQVLAYDACSVIAEKVETIVSKFPAIGHRLKDVLDVVVLAEELSFDGDLLLESLRATFERRETPADVAVLDDMGSQLTGRKWSRDWATMRKDKRVGRQIELADAIRRFDAFVRPLLVAVGPGRAAPGIWVHGGPWTSR